MSVEPVYVGGAPERVVGQVFASLTVSNAIDEGMARRGALEPDRVREVELREVLVDTGATHLSLPRRIIDELGLDVLREVEIATAAGIQTTRLYGDVRLQIEDRFGTFDCIELPGGEALLLGVIPLEALGFEPDLQGRRLRKLPMDRHGSYLTAFNA